MTTIRDKIRGCNFILNNIQKEQSRLVKQNTQKIIRLQVNQFTDGYGNDDKYLFNIQREYKGFYSPGYKKQGLYDFYETGLFIKGLFVKFDNGRIVIDSSGKGTGDKSIFFSGYTNLFGLNSYSRSILINESFSPQLMAFIKKYI